MADALTSILSSWEIETYIENLHFIKIEEFGSQRWFEHHKKLLLLNQQSVLEINNFREESIKENFINFRKISILICEAIQILVWKENIFPRLMNENDPPVHTFILFSIFYHEEVAVCLLENILFHSESIETIDNSVLDLIDYAVNYIIMLLYAERSKNESSDCEMNEILVKRHEIEFDLGLRAISIIRYLSEFSDQLPLAALARLLGTHDVPFLFVQLIEKKPWIKQNNEGKILIYNGKWSETNKADSSVVSKYEGQVWFGLREMLLNPKCTPYYDLTETRISSLTKLQKYINEQLLDQISPLMELRHWLSCLQVTAQSRVAQKPIIIEIISGIKNSIIEENKNDWDKIAQIQADILFSTDITTIKKIAQILTNAYDFDKLEIIEPNKCSNCSKNAKNRCSKCKNIWYCGRKCQVNDWVNHKEHCKTQE